MKAYKGFNKDMTCRDFQFKEGETYHEEEAELCSKGFHACEDPIDCFYYYEPANSEYHEVELEEVCKEKEFDSKICGKTIKIGAKLSIADICKVHFEYVKSKTKKKNDKDVQGDRSAASVQGDRSAASVQGDRSVASVQGDRSAASVQGDRSVASVQGIWSAASVQGDRSVASVQGIWSAASVQGDRSAASVQGDRSAASVQGDGSAASAQGDRSAASVQGDRSAASAQGYGSAASAQGDRSAASAQGNCSAASAQGYRSAASAQGYGSAASVQGYRSAASAQGNCSAASAQGDCSTASVQGNGSAGISTGADGRVDSSAGSISIGWGKDNICKGEIGSYIVLVERGKWDGEKYPQIGEPKLGKVDGITLKADTWYKLVNGKFVEVSDDDK